VERDNKRHRSEMEGTRQKRTETESTKSGKNIVERETQKQNETKKYIHRNKGKQTREGEEGGCGPRRTRVQRNHVAAPMGMENVIIATTKQKDDREKNGSGKEKEKENGANEKERGVILA
jgi:hypothetical protein